MGVFVMTDISKSRYAEIGRQMRELPREKACCSYEWEELVQKLCTSDDTRLHEIGVKELGVLKNNEQ
jgi:hypothetical protein